MFVKIRTPDNSVFLINPDRVRAIEEKMKGRSTIHWDNGDVLALAVGLDDAQDMLKGKSASTRARKTTSDS